VNPTPTMEQIIPVTQKTSIKDSGKRLREHQIERLERKRVHEMLTVRTFSGRRWG